MRDTVSAYFPGIEKEWSTYKRWFSEITVRSKTTLLREGEIPRTIFLVKEGSLRMSLYHKGKDITIQFFFEGEAVASFESFRSGRPSPIRLITVEPSTLILLQKEGFDLLLRNRPQTKDLLLDIAFRRFSHYSQLFISTITLTPRQRYLRLIAEEPKIAQRIPQRYIASYLGITPVSLSRIRHNIGSAFLNKG